MRVVGAPQMIHNQLPPFFPVLHCPLGLAELKACPLPDVAFPPLPLSALSSSPFRCALQDGSGQTWWTGNMTIPLQFASLYDRQEVFKWSSTVPHMNLSLFYWSKRNHRPVDASALLFLFLLMRNRLVLWCAWSLINVSLFDEEPSSTVMCMVLNKPEPVDEVPSSTVMCMVLNKLSLLMRNRLVLWCVWSLINLSLLMKNRLVLWCVWSLINVSLLMRNRLVVWCVWSLINVSLLMRNRLVLWCVWSLINLSLLMRNRLVLWCVWSLINLSLLMKNRLVLWCVWSLINLSLLMRNRLVLWWVWSLINLSLLHWSMTDCRPVHALTFFVLRF